MGEEKEVTLKEIIARTPENQKCIDCGMARPQWASTTYGVFICLNCAGVHRSFGVRVSVVKSVGMDMWPLSDIMQMEKGGNKRFKEYLTQYSLSALPPSELYLEKRVQEYAKNLKKEVEVVCPEEKKAAPKSPAYTRSSPKPRSTFSGTGSSKDLPRTQALSSSYTTMYPASIQSMPSMETIQTGITDILGKAAGYLYSGASTLSEKVIIPASSVIKEKSTQISEYLKRKDKKEEFSGKVTPHKKPAASFAKKETIDKWD